MSPVASTPTGTTGALIRSDGMVSLIGTADIRVADHDRLGGDADGGAAAVSGPVGLGPASGWVARLTAAPGWTWVRPVASASRVDHPGRRRRLDPEFVHVPPA